MKNIDQLITVVHSGNKKEYQLTNCLANFCVTVEGSLKRRFMVLLLLSITIFSENSIAPLSLYAFSRAARRVLLAVLWLNLIFLDFLTFDLDAAIFSSQTSISRPQSANLTRKFPSGDRQNGRPCLRQSKMRSIHKFLHLEADADRSNLLYRGQNKCFYYSKDKKI